MPAPPLTSPSTTYSGPPPPYSYPSSASSSVVGGNNGPLSGHLHGSFSSQNQRPSIDDKDANLHTINSPPKHTLPPINEALSISSILTTTAAPKSSFAAQSPISPVQRREADHTRPESRSHRPPSPKESKPPESRAAMLSFSPPIASSSIPAYSSMPYPPAAPPQAISTTHESQSYTRPSVSSSQPQISPTSSHQAPQRTESSMPLISSTYPYQQAYSYPPTTPGVAAYHTPLFDGRLNGSTTHQERAEEVRKAMPKDSPPHRHAYGEQVKRHLDIFDLETSLNEVDEITRTADRYS